MSIRSRAPNRIDLGGGTLDIWPLYLLLGRGVTLNVAVSVYSHVALDDEPGGGYRLVSEDTGYENAAKSLGALDFDGPLGLVARAVRYFDPPPGLRVVTRNEAPQGSGLGASSSLLVALLAALERLTRRAPGSTDLVNLAADLEAQVIRVPTGKQDHYAGVYGGANAIWFEPGRNRVESLPMPDS
ncbi:MAG: GHMP kinase, partial [Bacillota bacterium]